VSRPAWGAHLDGSDPARAGVAALLALGSGGAGEQEEALAAEIVDSSSHGVPDPGGELILVDQPGVLAVEHQTRVRLGCRERRVVLVETHLRGREAACGGRLADRLRTREQDGSMGAQAYLDKRLNDPLEVALRWPGRLQGAVLLGAKIVPIMTTGLYHMCCWH